MLEVVRSCIRRGAITLSKFSKNENVAGCHINRTFHFNASLEIYLNMLKSLPNKAGFSLYLCS